MRDVCINQRTVYKYTSVEGVSQGQNNNNVGVSGTLSKVSSSNSPFGHLCRWSKPRRLREILVRRVNYGGKKALGVELAELFQANELFKDVNSFDKSIMEK